MMQVYQRWYQKSIMYSQIIVFNRFRYHIILHKNDRTAKILTAFFFTVCQKHSCFLFWCPNSQSWVMFYRNFRNLSKGAHDRGVPSGDGQNGKQKCCRMAWFTREFCSTLIHTSLWFCTAEQCTCWTAVFDLSEMLNVTCNDIVIYFSPVAWFGLDLVSFCIWMRMCMNTNIQLSSPGFNTFSFLFQNLCFDSYQLFKLEALWPLFHWNLNPWMKTYRKFREHMWWRLVSSFSQIELFIFSMTRVACNSQMSFIFRLPVGLIFLH